MGRETDVDVRRKHQLVTSSRCPNRYLNLQPFSTWVHTPASHIGQGGPIFLKLASYFQGLPVFSRRNDLPQHSAFLNRAHENRPTFSAMSTNRTSFFVPKIPADDFNSAFFQFSFQLICSFPCVVISLFENHDRKTSNIYGLCKQLPLAYF